MKTKTHLNKHCYEYFVQILCYESLSTIFCLDTQQLSQYMTINTTSAMKTKLPWWRQTFASELNGVNTLEWSYAHFTDYLKLCYFTCL